MFLLSLKPRPRIDSAIPKEFSNDCWGKYVIFIARDGLDDDLPLARSVSNDRLDIFKTMSEYVSEHKQFVEMMHSSVQSERGPQDAEFGTPLTSLFSQLSRKLRSLGNCGTLADHHVSDRYPVDNDQAASSISNAASSLLCLI